MEADNEIWKDIEGYEGLYKVSSHGNVLSLKYCGSNRKHLLAPNTDHKGYLMAHLSKKGKTKTFKIHRLVASAFIPNHNNLPQVNHKDENPLNNCVNNLEWCDRAYNNNYGTIKQRRSVIMDAHPKTSKVVVCELSDGNKIEYPSARKAAKLLGVSSSTIINRCNGKYGEYNGMKFYYK